MNELPTDLIKYILSFSNIFDFTNLYLVNSFYNKIISSNKQYNFNKYKNTILINISDFEYIKKYIYNKLQKVIPYGVNINNRINNIIGIKKFITYIQLINLITILKLGRSLLLSNVTFNSSEFNNLENWINIAYNKYINCLSRRKNLFINNIFLLIYNRKVKVNS